MTDTLFDHCVSLATAQSFLPESVESSEESDKLSGRKQTPSVQQLAKSFEVQPVKQCSKKVLSCDKNDISRQKGSNQRFKEIVKKFELYIRALQKFTIPEKNRLFYCCALIGINKNVPYVKYRFPAKVELPAQIEYLCFPDADDLDLSRKAQNYSIVLTNDMGDRTYGYCRRILPEGSNKCLPLAYCILTTCSSPRFYRRILEQLEIYHGIPENLRDSLINEFYRYKQPTTSATLTFNLDEVNRYIYEGNSSDQRNEKLSEIEVSHTLATTNGFEILPKNIELNEDDFIEIEPENALIIRWDYQWTYKEVDLEELHNSLRLNVLEQVFASLLFERKVVFISKALGKLSICIEALQNILYPFSWPHALIPVLPRFLWQIVEAPTPLICGVLSTSMLEEYSVEGGIVVNLDEDKGTILSSMGDESNLIPSSLLKKFRSSIRRANQSQQHKDLYNTLLGNSFLTIFVHSCGSYRNYIQSDTFKREDFIGHPNCKYIKKFLKAFTETTMFHSFLESVLSDANSFTLFDNEITRVLKKR